MKNWTKVVAGVIALMLLVVCASAESAAEMPVPFGMASSSAPYYAKPCNERLASLPEALMKLADGGYSWEYDYVADKPAYALTLMDYANIYSFIHDHALDADAVRPDGTVADEDISKTGVMLDVMEFCQYPDYPTGCESVSLYMLLSYYGVDVKVDDIYDLLPMGDQPYDDEAGVRHGANPEREFVGDPRSEYSYGVFNEPIAQVAEQFKPGVRMQKGATIDDIKAILDTGNPVLAWYVSAPMRDIMYRWSWLDENGETVHWPGGEHAVVVCGYDDMSLTYRDPNAGTTVIIDYDTFSKSFDELGGRIVYYPAQD